MRRLAVLALVTGVASATIVGLDVAPASAHICPRPDEIRVGTAATISVGVTVEADAVPDVEITIPTGLHLDRVDARAGWTSTRTGATVRYHGGPIPVYSCYFFSLGVTAPGRGSFGIAVVQRTAGGKVVARSTPDPANPSDQKLGQVVYAGVKPPSSGSGRSLPITTIAGVALVGFGAVMFGVVGFRSRRARRDDADDDGNNDDEDDREAELQDRLERFKKQAPRRSAR